MPSKKSVVKKIFKVKRKTINDDKNNFVVRFKGEWSREELKEFRQILDECCAGIMHDLCKPKEPECRIRERDEY